MIQQQQGSMPTQTPEASHNVATALVEMYAGVIGDYKRAVTMLKTQLDATRAQLDAKDKENNELKGQLAGFIAAAQNPQAPPTAGEH